MSDTITEFGSVLQNAIETKKNDMSQLVWKGKDGVEVRLIDMSKDELQKAYNHTTDMLYNQNKYTPGKWLVKKNIKSLINSCNAELLFRYIMHENHANIFKTNIQLVDYIRTMKSSNNLNDSDSVSNIFLNLPSEYETVTIDDLMKACFDKLDIINRKMLSDNFILAQGIWLTEEEKQDLTEYDEEGKMKPWLDVIKDRLLMPNIKLRIDPHGFSYSEFRALVHLEPMPKISKLPTNTLRLLRDKVFLLLDMDTDYHIEKWNNIKTDIEKVAKSKDFELTSKSY